MSRFKPSPGRTTPRPFAHAAVAPRNGITKTDSPAAVATAVPGGEVTKKNVFQDPRFRAAVENSTRKLALTSTLIFIFFRFSFVHEYIAAKYWIDTHVLLIFGSISTVSCLAS